MRAATLELFQALLTDARSIAWPDPKSGASVGLLFGKMIEMWTPSWGLSEDVAKKAVLTPTVTAVADALRDRAPEEVGRAARGERDDQAQRLVGIRLYRGCCSRFLSLRAAAHHAEHNENGKT